MLKNLKCECCGAPLVPSFDDTEEYVCKYCNSRYEVKNENTPLQSVIRIETYHNPVRTLMAKFEIPVEELQALGDETVAEISMRNLTRNLAESLAPMMRLESQYDSIHRHQVITARVRVVEDDYRF